MIDIQNDPAEPALAIDRVGVKNLKLPLIVKDKERGRRHTVASVDLSVDLPAEFKGTHMSRFVEALKNWKEDLDYGTFRDLLMDVRDRLNARRAHVVFRFPYFLTKHSPASGSPNLMGYDCVLTGNLYGGKLAFDIQVEVPVMTVCPCSLAICRESAHSQRAVVRIRAGFREFLWLEDLIAVAEASGSSPVYSLLKREDERAVVEKAFSEPTFVEDVVRRAAHALDKHPKVLSYRVEVESLESIHDHNAYAIIEREKAKG